MSDHQCLNCQSIVPSGAEYCPNCGQSVKESRLSVWVLVKDAVGNVFNLDSRLFQTAKNIYVPSKLARAYVQGQRRRYVSPSRLFIYTLLLLIAAFVNRVNSVDFNKYSRTLYKKVVLGEQKAKWEEFVSKTKTQENEATLTMATDSMYQGVKDLDNLHLGGAGGIHFNLGDIHVDKLKIPIKDIFEMNPDEVLSKNKVENFWEKIIAKKYIKATLNTHQTATSIIKSFTWVMFSLIIVMSGFLWLLYRRNRHFYIEHMVLMMYAHSFMFIILAFLLFLEHNHFSSAFGEPLAATLLVTIILIQFLSMKRYYKQSWIKTFIKMILVNTVYIFMGFVLFVAGSVFSFLIS